MLLGAGEGGTEDILECGNIYIMQKSEKFGSKIKGTAWRYIHFGFEVILYSDNMNIWKMVTIILL